jgi:Fe-S-cluster-containing dehydrogenase component
MSEENMDTTCKFCSSCRSEFIAKGQVPACGTGCPMRVAIFDPTSIE